MTDNQIVSENKKVKKGYKKTKLGWIPDEWKIAKMDEIGNWKGGGTPSKSNKLFWQNGVIPWISAKDMKVNLIFEGEDYITLDAIKNSSTSIVKKNSILIVTRSGILRKKLPVAINMVDVTINQDLKALSVKKGINVVYVFNYFLCKNHELLVKCSKEGTTVESIEYSDLKKFPIPLPPLPEQKKIAQILSTWDKAIDLTQQLIKQLSTRKKGLMQQLLTGKLRLKGFSGDWEKVRLGKIIEERKEYPKDELPLYSLTIKDGVTPKTERYERSFLIKSKTNAYKKMVSGDFALNPMNLRFGAIAKYKDDHDISVSKYYNIFHCNDKCDSTFLEYYLTSYNMIQYYNKMAIGSLEEKKRVHFSDFIKFKKALPSKSEQIAIANILSRADKEIKHQESYLSILQTQKKGLMQKLLTGQKRVKINK